MFHINPNQAKEEGAVEEAPWGILEAGLCSWTLSSLKSHASGEAEWGGRILNSSEESFLLLLFCLALVAESTFSISSSISVISLSYTHASSTNNPLLIPSFTNAGEKFGPQSKVHILKLLFLFDRQEKAWIKTALLTTIKGIQSKAKVRNEIGYFIQLLSQTSSRKQISH